MTALLAPVGHRRLFRGRRGGHAAPRDVRSIVIDVGGGERVGEGAGWERVKYLRYDTYVCRYGFVPTCWRVSVRIVDSRH